MTRPPETCPRCSRAIPDNAYVCNECVREAQKDLTNTADFLTWTDDKRARRTSRLWIGHNSPSAETAIPYDARVRHTLNPIRRHLTTWAEHTINQHPATTYPKPADNTRIHNLTTALNAWNNLLEDAQTGTYPNLTPEDLTIIRAFRDTTATDLTTARAQADLTDLTTTAIWLEDHCEWIATKPWAHDAFNDFQQARETLIELFDNPPDTTPLGPCNTTHTNDQGQTTTCDHPLEATPDATTTTCPRCGHNHDVQRRRLDALKTVDDLSVTVNETSRLLRLAGHDINERILRELIHLDGIESTSTTHTGGKPARRYPLGALRQAAERYTQDKDTRRSVRASLNVPKAPATLHASA